MAEKATRLWFTTMKAAKRETRRLVCATGAAHCVAVEWWPYARGDGFMYEVLTQAESDRRGTPTAPWCESLEVDCKE